MNVIDIILFTLGIQKKKNLKKKISKLFIDESLNYSLG